MTGPRTLVLAAVLLPACHAGPTPNAVARATIVGTWRCEDGCDRGETVGFDLGTDGLNSGAFRAWLHDRLIETGTWRRTGDSLVVSAGGFRSGHRIRRLTADTLVLDGDVRTRLVRIRP